MGCQEKILKPIPRWTRLGPKIVDCLFIVYPKIVVVIDSRYLELIDIRLRWIPSLSPRMLSSLNLFFL